MATGMLLISISAFGLSAIELIEATAQLINYLG